MTITVPQARLILNTVMLGLRNNLAGSDLIDWEIHSQEMNDRNRLTVTEQVGPEYNITETADNVSDLSSGVQSTVFGGQTFTLNKIFGLSMGASDIEMIRDLRDARRSRALNNGIARLATRIDYHIMQTAMKAFPHSTGTWGTGLDDPAEFATARARLANFSIESDIDLNGVINHDDKTLLAKYIYNDNAALAEEGPRAMRRGFSGMLAGIPIKASNMLGVITTGTRDGSGTVAGANQNKNYADVADAGSNAGYYLTQVFNVAGMGSLATVKAGEVFSITSGTAVNAWDADKGASRGFAQQFVVVEDATADTSGAFALRIFPAIIVGDGTTTIGTGGINNAHRTVTAAPDNGATVTFLGSASTAYMPRMMWRKDAIVAHSAPLIMPYTGQGFRRSLANAQQDRDKATGIPPLMPRLWMYSDPNTGEHRARIDVFVQAQARDRWAGIKFFGS